MKTQKFNNTLGACLASYWTNFLGWGRATRSEFWWSYLFYRVLFGWFLMLITCGLWWFITLIPNFTLRARRLHDAGYSNWLVLLNFIPIVGWIVLLILYCQPSDKSNKYGKPRI